MKKLVFMSDTHGYHHHIPEVPDGDILVHCGDFTMGGSIQECVDFALWFKSQPHTYKVLIAGNHEKSLAEKPEFSKQLFTFCYYLENSSIEIEGINFYGTPWTPSFARMRDGLAFYGDNMEKLYGKVPENTDVLVTHGPPANILDLTSQGNCHVGDGFLLYLVQKIQPKIHSFGHIHEPHGVMNGYANNKKTTFINCSLVDGNYNLINKPIVKVLR